MEPDQALLTPEVVSETVTVYLSGRLADIDWHTSGDRFGWCGEVLDYLVEGLEQHIAPLGITFHGTYPGPFKLWDEEQHADGEHVRRFWTTACCSKSGRPVAKLCTFFFHRHDRLALPRPPRVVAFTPSHDDKEVDEDP